MLAVTRTITGNKDAVNVIRAPDGQNAAAWILKQETALNLAFYRTADLTENSKPIHIITAGAIRNLPDAGVMIASKTNILRIAPVGLSVPGEPPGTIGSGQVIMKEHFLTNDTVIEFPASQQENESDGFHLVDEL